MRLTRISALAIVLVLLAPTAAQAAVPTDNWTAAGLSGGVFSRDGTLVLATGSSGAGGRIELRRTTNGTVVRAITDPLSFSAAALSADNLSIAATGLAPNSIRTIRLYRVADGALLRTIATDADRDMTALDFSPDGRLLASMERRSYGAGGRVRLHVVATGALDRLLPAGHSTTGVSFSPDGRYLAANDQNITNDGLIGGVRVFRTSDWTSVLTTTNGSRIVRWAPDGNMLWVKNYWTAGLTASSARLVSVPSGAVLRSPPTTDYTNVRDVTPDDRRLVADRAAVPQTVIRFLDATTGANVLTYDFANSAFVTDVSPDGIQFAYSVTGTGGIPTLHIGRTPS